jgi:hypothetical protein
MGRQRIGNASNVEKSNNLAYTFFRAQTVPWHDKLVCLSLALSIRMC